MQRLYKDVNIFFFFFRNIVGGRVSIKSPKVKVIIKVIIQCFSYHIPCVLFCLCERYDCTRPYGSPSGKCPKMLKNDSFLQSCTMFSLSTLGKLKTVVEEVLKCHNTSFEI